MNLSPERVGRRQACQMLTGLLSTGLATGVGAQVPASDIQRPLQVLASFSVLADLARQIAGRAAEVSTLAGSGADPHAYSPSPGDLQRLARADLVIVNGLGFEAWLDRLVANASLRGKLVVASDGVDVRRVTNQTDPHAWLSPRQARRYVDNVEAGLMQAWSRIPNTGSIGTAPAPAPAPASASASAAARQAELRHRAQHVRERLAQIDEQTRQTLSSIAADHRRAVTPHGAFGYFGRDHDVAFTALHGLSPNAEASAAQLARVVRQVRSQRAVALFAEAGSDTRLLQRVADETGLPLAGVLYAESLSTAGGPADNYLDLMAHNARTIAQGLLQGVKPPANSSGIHR